MKKRTFQCDLDLLNPIENNDVKNLLISNDDKFWKTSDLRNIVLSGNILHDPNWLMYDSLISHELKEILPRSKKILQKKIGFLSFKANVIDLYHSISQTKKILGLDLRKIFERSENAMIKFKREKFSKKIHSLKISDFELINFFKNIDIPQTVINKINGLNIQDEDIYNNDIKHLNENDFALLSETLNLNPRLKKLLEKRGFKRVLSKLNLQSKRVKKAIRHKKDPEITEKLAANFEKYQKNKFSISSMAADLQREFGASKKIKKSSFYNKYLNGGGYVFKKGKLRFGAYDNERKLKSRLVNSLLIQELSLSNTEIYFYDEMTVSIGTFNRKYWWKINSDNLIRFHKPTLIWKVNMLVSSTEVIAFELSDGKHLQKDVEQFLIKASASIRKKDHRSETPLIVLDNGPKNRSKRMWTLASDGHFRPLYITPCTPEQNFIEHFFGAIKRHFSSLRNLDFLNAQKNPALIFSRALILAIKNAADKDLIGCKLKFMGELHKSILNDALLFFKTH